MKHLIPILLGLLAPATVYTQSILDGLILYYMMDGNANDTSGNNLDGAVVGATLTSDRLANPNSAYSFDGVNDYIDLPNSTILEPQPPVTFAFWTKVPSLNIVGSHFFVTDLETGDYNGYWVSLSADNLGKPFVNYGGGSGLRGYQNRRSKIANLTLTANTWHHITAVVRGATDMDLYLDCVDAGGSYDGDGSATVGYSNNPGSLARESGNSSPQYFNGELDEFAFWNRALSQSEVEGLCQGSLNIALSTGDVPEKLWLSVYPNPTASLITVHGLGETSDYVIELQSLLGEKVATIHGKQADLSALPNGVFVLRVFDDKGHAVLTKKIVKD